MDTCLWNDFCNCCLRPALQTLNPSTRIAHTGWMGSFDEKAGFKKINKKLGSQQLKKNNWRRGISKTRSYVHVARPFARTPSNHSRAHEQCDARESREGESSARSTGTASRETHSAVSSCTATNLPTFDGIPAKLYHMVCTDAVSCYFCANVVYKRIEVTRADVVCAWLRTHERRRQGYGERKKRPGSPPKSPRRTWPRCARRARSSPSPPSE